MQEGLTAPPIAPRDQTAESHKEIAYDPYKGPGPGAITLPDGTEIKVNVEIKTPDVIEA